MKPAIASVFALFLAVAAIGRADLVIVQKVDGAGQSGEQTIKIKGDKSRSDVAQAVSMITDGATGEMITLVHTSRTFLKISPAQTKAMVEQIQKAGPKGGPAKLEPTGKKEKIGEYECEIFTTNLGLITVTYWIAKDFPNYQGVLEQLMKFQAGAISAMGSMPALKDFPGMMMKTEMDLNGKKTTTVLVSVKEEVVDPKIFNIPTGYKEVTSPALSFPPPK